RLGQGWKGAVPGPARSPSRHGAGRRVQFTMNRQQRTPLRILYVEDNAEDFELARRALAKYAPEYSVDHASLVRTALACLADGTRYDAVLTDLRLPDGTGIDILTHVRRQRLPGATAVLPGSRDQETGEAAPRSGAHGFPHKHTP